MRSVGETTQARQRGQDLMSLPSIPDATIPEATMPSIPEASRFIVSNSKATSSFLQHQQVSHTQNID